jgi:hypothetical protein
MHRRSLSFSPSLSPISSSSPPSVHTLPRPGALALADPSAHFCATSYPPPHPRRQPRLRVTSPLPVAPPPCYLALAGLSAHLIEFHVPCLDCVVALLPMPCSDPAIVFHVPCPDPVTSSASSYTPRHQDAEQPLKHQEQKLFKKNHEKLCQFFKNTMASKKCCATDNLFSSSVKSE